MPSPSILHQRASDQVTLTCHFNLLTASPLRRPIKASSAAVGHQAVSRNRLNTASISEASATDSSCRIRDARRLRLSTLSNPMDTMAAPELEDPSFGASCRVLKPCVAAAKLGSGSGSFVRRVGSFVADSGSLPQSNMPIFCWILNGSDGGQTPLSRLQHKNARGKASEPRAQALSTGGKLACTRWVVEAPREGVLPTRNKSVCGIMRCGKCYNCLRRRYRQTNMVQCVTVPVGWANVSSMAPKLKR
jgi:hypothetical protein